MTTEENDIVWVADFGLDGHRDYRACPPQIGTATVVKRTAKQVRVLSNRFTGYRTLLATSECYDTREALVEGIKERCEKLAQYHEKLAAQFREVVK